LADWYLEIAKVEGGKREILLTILESILKLWHPFMPFVTEHVWKVAGFKGQLIVAAWPTMKRAKKSSGDFEKLRALIGEIRRVRAEQGMEPTKIVACSVVTKTGKLIEANRAWIERLARCTITVSKEIPKNWVTSSVSGWHLGIDATREETAEDRQKIQKELVSLESYLVSQAARLGNKEFRAKAPAAVIKTMEEKLEEARQKKEILKKRLGE